MCIAVLLPMMLRFAIRLFFVLLLTWAPSSYATRSLSLNDAILLAVRNNPNVQSAQLSDLSEKLNLSVQEWQFYPHYSLAASMAFARAGTAGSHIYNIQPGASLLTPFGTQLSLTSSNTKANHYNLGLSMQMMQPLMRGFGRAVVEAALNNAKDSKMISTLNVEGLLRTTVTAVINAYLDIVSAERTILIDEDAVERAETSVRQTKLFIKAGHKAGNELVTVEANVASAKSRWINDKNNLLQAQYALLAAIGIDPNSDVHFSNLNVYHLIQKYHLPTLPNTKKSVLENDIQYQVDNITLHGPTTRALLLAEDNMRWQLNLTGTMTAGGVSGNAPQNSNRFFSAANQSRSVGLTLQIPIDDQAAKQSLANAKIALKQAELALMQEKWNKETSAINGWNLVVSAERAMHFAEEAEKWQKKTYSISFQKYIHGLIDSLELQSAQLQLIESQQTLLNAQINYLKALVNLDFLIGHTLKTWHIGVRTE